jgi:(p)ppGpp synthase/HD superfamily hydrolase
MTHPAQTYPQLAIQLSAAGWSENDLVLVRRAAQESWRLFAAAYRASGKPVVDHLVGTASATFIGGGGPDEVAAALLHAAYDAGDFGTGRRGPKPRHRAHIRECTNERTEAIVHRYHEHRWTPEAAALALATPAVSGSVAARALLVRVANEIDEALDAGVVLAQKSHHPVHSREVNETTVALAAVVGTPELHDLAAEVLLCEPSSLPAALCIGWGDAQLVLPRSVGWKPKIRATRIVSRWLRRARRVRQVVGRR